MLTVSCRWCGTEYQTTTEHDVYCSQVCMDAAIELGEDQDLPTIEAAKAHNKEEGYLV